MIPVLRAARMRAADAAAIRSGVPSELLMENAGAALVAELRRRYPDWRRLVVVCGPGNNGGDGLVAARLLAQASVAASVFTLGDPESYRGDPAANLARLRGSGVSVARLTAGAGRAFLRALADCDGVLDALFGTGLTRPLAGDAGRAVGAVNRSGRPIVAADVPSGLETDGGGVAGPAVRAALTVALGAPKPCHLLPPASGHCGRLVVADIGISRRILDARGERFGLAERTDVSALLAARPLESNKGDFGRLAVIAGSSGKAGAAILAARGALRAGAGLVTIFCAESLAGLMPVALPEAMTQALPEEGGAIAASAARIAIRLLAGFDAAVLGPGLGTAAGTVAFLEEVLARVRIPLVLDADALNAFAGRPSALARPGGARIRTILTPHPGEAGRLLGTTARAVQADRLGAVRALARAARGIAVLKGAHTLVSDARGETVANPTGTPLLATGGTGDVLAGTIGALLAGRLAPRDAAIAGAWIHGGAAEALEPRLGDAGLLAHEVADALPGVRRGLRPPDSFRDA